MKENVRPEVRRFAAAMEEKLCQREYKTSWEKDTRKRLFFKLAEEIVELFEALDTPEMLGEAVDVANFAMMLWHKGKVEQRQEARK